MPTIDIEQLRSVRTFPSLVKYLREELDWPITADDADTITFEYSAQELGLPAEYEDLVKEIKQLRPLETNQPWGIFWVSFDKKRLPVVMLRRILGHLVLKKRATANQASQPAWRVNDLLFISAYGEESDRAITFAHFSQPADSPGDLPVLKVLGWDGGDTVLHLVEAHRALVEKLRWPPDPHNLAAWRNQWASAFTVRHREVITTTEELVKELARLAEATRRRARTILARESDRGPLRRLYAAFKTALIHDLTEDDFADVIAQTISYGLLIARFSRAAISAQNLVDMVPATNPFLRELLQTFLALAGRQSAFDFDELGIQDVVEVLNRSNADAVKADFGNRARGEDPVIHFYEHFLAAYDRQKKIQRGVFYTPQPVVSYIVRSVHELLQKEFGIEDGLASTETWGDLLRRNPGLKLPKIRVPKAGKAEGEEAELSPEEFFVLILDIATGTGTFLVESIEAIFQHLQAKWAKHGLQGMPIIRHTALRLPQFKDYWNAYVPAALLPRLYGYELMMAPYTIAHMKLALKFSEINARLGQSDTLFNFGGRANIYLTNTLEPPSGFQTQEFAEFFPALAHEAAAVNNVKRTKRFTVVIGNPPYSISSQNSGPWITQLVNSYKTAVRQERNIQPLSDDYVKFFRFGQYSVESSGIGILSYISNHTFFSGLIHRGMRHEMGQAFSSMFLLDLNGSALLGLETADGHADQNVFDIQQGVGITFGCAKPNHHKTSAQPRVQYFSLWGERAVKYAFLLANTCNRIENRKLGPVPPNYFFVPTAERDSAYDSWGSLDDIFIKQSTGLETGRDEVLITFDRAQIHSFCLDLHAKHFSDSQLAQTYTIKDTSGWPVSARRKEVQSSPLSSLLNSIRLIQYRLFDKRFTIYGQFLRRAQLENMRHMLTPNLGLVATRMIKGERPAHFYVVRDPIEKILISPKTSNNAFLFPLYLSDEKPTGPDKLQMTTERETNFNSAFLTRVSSSLGLHQAGSRGLPDGITPEDIFHYAYAVFHSPGYRSRYAEFLKIDFPRLPLTSSIELFRALAALGSELVSLDLMESPKLEKHLTNFQGSENPEVERVTWSDDTVWLDKSQTAGFAGVPEPVWNFHIGGYQVCEKWLKDRKGRTLSAEDIAHYHKIIVALAESIRLMSTIDQVIEQHGGWPLK